MKESEVTAAAGVAQEEYIRSDEDSESDDESSRHRGRFRTERTLSCSAHLSKLQNNMEKRDIPDKLGKFVFTGRLCVVVLIHLFIYLFTL